MKTKTARTITMATVCAVAVLGLGTAPTLAADAPPTAPATMLAPYYTELDVTGDRQVTTADLEFALDRLGLTSAADEWPDVAILDHDADEVLTIADIANLSQRMIYDDGPFELLEASVIEMQAAMNAGVTTSVEITQAYLDRIAAYDRTVVTGGTRALNAIVTVSQTALDDAAAADAIRADQGMTSMLLGVPIALKDNFNTDDMVTTGGCGCWNANQTATDATMVAGLRDAGAVILAKASLDEFAYGFVSQFSSFQAPGSTLLVASPYDTSRTAGGSSGGTSAAIAANLSGIGFGTDTGGSIRVPSSYNQLVGVRPTVGLASRHGIIPLALSQDTGGPIARSVVDAAVALDAVVGIDAADPVTSRQQGLVPESYTMYLNPNALQGTRIGWISSMTGSNNNTNAVFAQARADLQALGATVVLVTPPTGFDDVLNETSGANNEFKHDLNLYIAEHLAPGVTQRSLAQIIAGGNFVTSRQSIYNTRNNVSEMTYQNWAGPSGSHTLALAAGKVLVTQMLDDLDLDALVYPSTGAYATIGTNMRLSPNTGMPAVSVPMGSIGNGQGGSTIGINLEFFGRDFSEGLLLGLAYSFEQGTQARTTPTLFGPLP